MYKVLLWIDDTADSRLALQHILETPSCYLPPAICNEWHLYVVAVVPRLTSHAAPYLSLQEKEAWYQDQGRALLAPAQALLDEAQIRYSLHVEVGEPTERILAFANERHCQKVLLPREEPGWLRAIKRGADVVRLREDLPVQPILPAQTSASAGIVAAMVLGLGYATWVFATSE